MKLYSSEIFSASDIGTTFYKISPEDVDRVFNKKDTNMILKEAFKTYGWEALDIDRMWGSIIDGDYLYLCVTDGYDIEVNGEEVDPESALEMYGVDACSDYVQDGNEDIISSHITEYEIGDVDIDEIALSLLQSGYHFSTIVLDAEELGLINND